MFIVLNEVSIMLCCILYGSDKKNPLTFSQDIFHNSIERIMINVQIISFEEKNKSDIY